MSVAQPHSTPTKFGGSGTPEDQPGHCYRNPAAEFCAGLITSVRNVSVGTERRICRSQGLLAEADAARQASRNSALNMDPHQQIRYPASKRLHWLNSSTVY